MHAMTMTASTYDRYGPAEVLRMERVARPEPGAGEILVRVAAAGVTTADWRLRAAAFPGIMAVPGRLMFGLFRPRNRVLGHDFAGEVVATGPGVARLAPGARVFGFAAKGGAHAEYLVIREDAAVAEIPEGLDATEAAALPFGALAALAFLRDVGGVTAGQSVLVIGASGGVGAYAVQIARALGARVTGVASGANLEMVRDLGAGEAVDYRTQDPAALGRRFDVVLDTVGAMRFREARRVLRRGGRFVPLNFGLREMLQALVTGALGRRKVRVGVSGDTREGLEELAGMVRAGTVRPVIDRVLPFGRIREAYRHVEGRHRKGAVILTLAAPAQLRSAA